jgi:DNA-binding PadR family transcriptional regulator
MEEIMSVVDKSLLKGNTKMLVLSIIDLGNKYGYEIIKELEARSYGAFALKEGTLYPILHDLEREELIISSTYQMENNRIRKYYKITKKGKAYLFNKKKEWYEFVSKVNVIIGKSI